jgi:hypothetical protein
MLDVDGVGAAGIIGLLFSIKNFPLPFFTYGYFIRKNLKNKDFFDNSLALIDKNKHMWYNVYISL